MIRLLESVKYLVPLTQAAKKDGAFDLGTQIIAYATRLCTGTPISGFDKVFIILVGYLNTLWEWSKFCMSVNRLSKISYVL